MIGGLRYLGLVHSRVLAPVGQVSYVVIHHKY